MTPLTTLRTAQLFQMSCPLISSTVGIRIGSTAAAWLVDSPPAPAPAADGSGEAIPRYLLSLHSPLGDRDSRSRTAAGERTVLKAREAGWVETGEELGGVYPRRRLGFLTPSSKKREGRRRAGNQREAEEGIPDPHVSHT